MSKHKKTKGKIHWPSAAEERQINRGIAADEDAPVWTDAMFTTARRGRGPQKAPKKVPITLRLDSDIVAHFKTAGPGYQSRINEVLRDHIH